MFRWLLLLLLGVAVALGLVIGTLNPEVVAFDLVFMQTQWPLGALMLACFICGFLLALVIAMVSRWFHKATHRSG